MGIKLETIDQFLTAAERHQGITTYYLMHLQNLSSCPPSASDEQKARAQSEWGKALDVHQSSFV